MVVNPNYQGGGLCWVVRTILNYLFFASPLMVVHQILSICIFVFLYYQRRSEDEAEFDILKMQEATEGNQTCQVRLRREQIDIKIQDAL